MTSVDGRSPRSRVIKLDARIKTLLKPVLDQNPDLVLSGSTLWLRPVRHIGRRIVIKQDQAHCFKLEWGLLTLFVPFAHPLETPDWFSDSIERSSLVRWVDYHPMRRMLTRSGEDEYMNWGRYHWNYDDPTVAEDLLFQIGSVLRLVRSLDTLEKCVAFLHNQKWDAPRKTADWAMFAHLALGHVGPARAHWIAVRQRYLMNLVEEPRTPVELRNSRYCELDIPLTARDRAALSDLLHRWETDNVEALKLTGIWERSPFPLERASGMEVLDKTLESHPQPA